MALTKQQMLDDARAAYHRIMTGANVVEFKDQNGESVRYSAANSAKLASYIRQLETELGEKPPMRPTGVWFG